MRRDGSLYETAGGRALAAGLGDFWPGARAGGLLLCLLLAGLVTAAAAVLGHSVDARFDLSGLVLMVVWLAAMGSIVRGGAASASGALAWGGIAVLAALAVGLRLWSVSLTQDVALGADPMNYTNLAQAVLEGRGLITDDWRYGEDLRSYFPPLYPLALAGFWALLGQSAASTLAMHALIDLIAAWALTDVARRLGLGGRSLAIAAAYLAWPAFALAAGIPQKESLTVMLAILLLRGIVLWLGDHGAVRRAWRHGPWLGLWWGLLALTQPSLALAPGAVALVLWPRAGLAAVLRLGLACAPTLVLVLAPWWLRNAIILGTFVPFTTASGMMLNSALNELRAPFPPGLFAFPEHERGAIMAAKAQAILSADPVGSLLQMIRNLAVGFAYEEASLARFRHTTPPISAAEHARLFPVLQGSYLALLLSALAGVIVSLRARQNGFVIVMTAALVVSIAVINPWFEFGERHRLVLTPFLLLLGASWWCRGLPPTCAR